MVHLYQPMMIKTLLEQGDGAEDKEIAKFDQSQKEYYQKITNPRSLLPIRSEYAYCQKFSNVRSSLTPTIGSFPDFLVCWIALSSIAYSV